MLQKGIELRKKIPFLNLIPDAYYSALHFDEFYFPDIAINHVRELLESELNCYIMLYHPFTFTSMNKHAYMLCQLIQSATLTQKQLLKLKSYEQPLAKHIVLVAYQKPLQFLICPCDLTL